MLQVGGGSQPNPNDLQRGFTKGTDRESSSTRHRISPGEKQRAQRRGSRLQHFDQLKCTNFMKFHCRSLLWLASTGHLISCYNCHTCTVIITFYICILLSDQNYKRKLGLDDRDLRMQDNSGLSVFPLHGFIKVSLFHVPAIAGTMRVALGQIEDLLWLAKILGCGPDRWRPKWWV